MSEVRPHYITTSRGQIRLWLAGSGPNLVAIAGLTTTASVLARRLVESCPGWRIIVVELPGIGGSAGMKASTLDEIASGVADALTWLDGEPFIVAGFELACPVAMRLGATHVGANPAMTVCVGGNAAAAWARLGIGPGDLSPRQDGTHLTALWAFLRDRHLLDPVDPHLPATDGEPLPEDAELSETFVAAAVNPHQFAALWETCAAAMREPQPSGAVAAALTTDLPELLAERSLPEGRAVPQATAALPDGAIWHDYVETRNGRMHLRRSGDDGRPLLVIPTGGGSSAQFAPVITGLSNGRQVFAVDYLGNGLSDKPAGKVSVETLADDMVAVLDAMGFAEVDVWGSHTGALVALELAVIAPERVGRLVMEGPVFISQDFQDDLLANYFPVIKPDKWGMHLPLVWNWRRDLFMFWPWYRVEYQAARALGVPSAEELHKYAIGILESGTTYDGAYRSAFFFDTRTRLPKLTRPGLVCAGPDDMLKDGLADARRLGPEGLVTVAETPTTVWWPDPDPVAAAETLVMYDTFLGAGT